MYIADTDNSRIRKVMISSGIISSIAGSGTSGSFSGDGSLATSATLYYPEGVALDSAGTITLLYCNCMATSIMCVNCLYRKRVHR